LHGSKRLTRNRHMHAADQRVLSSGKVTHKLVSDFARLKTANRTNTMIEGELIQILHVLAVVGWPINDTKW
jgi:hypothetical protein